jgi:hypothetical protein
MTHKVVGQCDTKMHHFRDSTIEVNAETRHVALFPMGLDHVANLIVVSVSCCGTYRGTARPRSHIKRHSHVKMLLLFPHIVYRRFRHPGVCR